MPCESGGGDAFPWFALVAYIPDPLRQFLDDLRKELVPTCLPHAHVTILPPRPLAGEPEDAIRVIRSRIGDFSPFEIKAGQIEMFDVSDVVYLAIASGEPELRQMYRTLNIGPLHYQEAFPYHPHITLAQDLPAGKSAELAALARRRWAEFPHKRSFAVESLAFVRRQSGNLWIDLAHFQLDPAPSIRRR